MKKWMVFLCFVLCSVLLSAFAAANAAPLSNDAAIVVSETANAYETAAAERLRDRLNACFSLDLPITTNADAAGYRLYIGSAAGVDLTGKADGSYVLRSVPGGMALAGAGTHGNINAVYAFLERFGGCKVYTAERGMTTEQDALLLPEDADIAYTPFFEYTDTDWHSPRDIEYSLMNGLNGGPYRQIPAQFGGSVNYISNFCHTLATQFCSRNTYFAAHPEYFALRNGERTDRQLCLTNEDVYQVVLGEVMALLEQRHDPNAALQILSLTQDDNQEYCECPACKALDEANGSHAGTMITFVNRIARAVAAAGYDNVGIDTFAYQYTRRAPGSVVPEPNVIIRLCSIECCFSHALTDTSCAENAAFIRDLEDWSALSDRLYIWDYTTNYANTLGPFPDFGVLQKNMQCFYEHNVRGVYEEGAYYVDACDTEFGELRAYLIAKLLQDPYCDYDAEMNGFLKAYYGAGWKAIRQYIDKTNTAAAKTHVMIYEPMISTFVLSNEEVRELDALWAQAKAKAQGEALAHVKRSEISWRYWKAWSNRGEFAGLLSSVSAREQLMADIRAHGVTMFHEGKNNEVSPLYRYVAARYWQELPETDEAGNISVFEKVKYIVLRQFDLIKRFRIFFTDLGKERMETQC